MVDQATPESYEMKHTDGYKNYSGHAGWKAWVEFLTTIGFPDFTVEECVQDQDEPSLVHVKTSYTPTVNATGKTGCKMNDLHRWVVTGGKISQVKFLWGSPEQLDELFNAN